MYNLKCEISKYTLWWYLNYTVSTCFLLDGVYSSIILGKLYPKVAAINSIQYMIIKLDYIGSSPVPSGSTLVSTAEIQYQTVILILHFRWDKSTMVVGFTNRYNVILGRLSLLAGFECY